MLKKNSILNKMETVLGSLKIKDPAKASKEDIANAIDAVAEQCRFERKGPNGKIIAAILEGADTFGEDKGKLVKKIYKDIANGVGKVMKNSHTSWSQFIKIAVGVCVTLPITCTALNWVYPRFMEIFFPKLAGVKKDPQPQKTGGDK